MVMQMTDQSSLRRPPTRLKLTRADVDELSEMRLQPDFGKKNKQQEQGVEKEKSKRDKGSATKMGVVDEKKRRKDEERESEGRRGRSVAERLGIE